MTTIYIVMIEDRHYDTEAHPFSTPERALDFAKAYLADHADSAAHVDPEDASMSAEDLTEVGWLFYAQYSVEGDCIWVLPKVIDEEPSDG